MIVAPVKKKEKKQLGDGAIRRAECPKRNIFSKKKQDKQVSSRNEEKSL